MSKRVMGAVLAAAVAVAPLASIELGWTSAAWAKGKDDGGGNGGGSSSSSDRGKSGDAPGRTKSESSGKASGGKSSGARSGGGGSSKAVAPKSGKSTKSSKAKKTSAPAKSMAPKAKPENGSIRSKLKWLNAAHASLQAYANAAPNSRVGQIAAYRAMLIESARAGEEYDAAVAAYLETLNGLAPDQTPEDLERILAEIQALNDDGEVTDAELEAYLREAYPDADDETIAAALAALDGAIESDDALHEAEMQRETWRSVLDGLQADQTPEDLDAALAEIGELNDDGEVTDEELAAYLADRYPDADPAAIDAAVAELRDAVAADDADQALDDARLALLDGLDISEDSPEWEYFLSLLRLDQPLPGEAEAGADVEEPTPDDGTVEP